MEIDLLADEHVLPVDRETTATALRVTGEIPKFLNGRYVRTGPNPLPGQYDPNNYSVFGVTGDGMVHGVRLRDGRAEWYRSRWVRTPKVSRLLGEKPKPANYRAGITTVSPQTNVYGFAGKTIVSAEGGVAPYELNDELETVGTCDFGRTLEGGTPDIPSWIRSPASCMLSPTNSSGRRWRVMWSSIPGARCARTCRWTCRAGHCCTTSP